MVPTSIPVWNGTGLFILFSPVPDVPPSQPLIRYVRFSIDVEELAAVSRMFSGGFSL